MPDTEVRYRNASGKEVTLPIRFLGAEANFRLETDRIETRMTAEIGPRLMDLLEIAAAVFCADTSYSRGRLDQPGNGRAWRRSFSFRFAVRDHAFWADEEVTRALRNTLEFMTGDTFDCAFAQADFSPGIQSYFQFDTGASEVFDIDDVILFSGGLDSLAGTLQTLRETDRRVALVTHFSAPKTINRQTELVKRLSKNFAGRFLWIPVHVHRRGSAAKESTQRSRSFLFAALGCVVARMLGADRLRFFENGIVSQNLPLAPPIVGTLATRTTHPRTLKNLADFLSQVAGRPFDVTNTFEWLTKTEVVRIIKRLGQSELISSTVSCNHTFKRTTAERHCGSCSQCMDRRFAILANGLARHDPAADYTTDVIFGGREKEDERALAIEWVRHARRLAWMSREAFNEKFIGELTRISSAFPDRHEAYEKTHELHRRHGQSVVTVLEKSLSDGRLDTADGSIASAFSGLPDTPPAIEPPAESEPTTSPRIAGNDNDIIELVRHSPSMVTVVGLQDFSGPRARILSCLLDLLIDDRRLGRAIKDFRGLNGRKLADSLGGSEENVRQDIRRLKSDLKGAWTAIHDAEPPDDLLIRNNRGKGYHLNPRIHLVTPGNAG